MEKSNSRARRNGNGPQPGSSTNTPATEAVGGLTDTPTSAKAGRSEQTTKLRNEAGPGTSAMEHADGPRSLQDTFIDERNDVLAVINELEDQLDRHQEIRETVERELTATSEKLQAANQRVQELEWQVVTLQTRTDSLEQLRSDVTSLEEELADANARALRDHEQVATAEKERTRLKGELKAASKQADEFWTVSKERDGLRSEYKTLSAKVEELERTQRETLAERVALQTQLQEAQTTLEDTVTDRNKLQMTLRSAEDRIHELAQVQDALADKIEALRAEKKNAQAQLAHLERENARLVEQRQFYECEVTSLRNQARTAESALTSVKKAFGEVRVALTETKSRARRRGLDTWPRIGSTLRGVMDDPGATGNSMGFPVAAMVGVPDTGATDEVADTPATTNAPAATAPDDDYRDASGQ